MFFERRRYVERSTINGVEWMRSRGASPQGLVIAPPLIGGHALQQLRLLRPLARRHLDLMSYNFAGHGASKGAFSIQASVENSLVALDLAVRQSRQDGLPLYGIASCFAAIPMLQTLHRRSEPLAKLVLINALPNLQWESMVVEFCRYWRNSRQWRPTLKSLQAALQAYRDELLPNVSHDRQAFGILSHHRIQWSRMIRDVVAYRKLDSQPLIPSTPVLCIYGRQDRILKQIGFTHWEGYEALIERICPRVRFLRIDGDHFLTGEGIRRKLIAKVGHFLIGQSS